VSLSPTPLDTARRELGRLGDALAELSAALEAGDHESAYCWWLHADTCHAAYIAAYAEAQQATLDRLWTAQNQEPTR